MIWIVLAVVILAGTAILVVSNQTTRKPKAPTMAAAQLPPQMVEENTIFNMKVGESGYAVPWAMLVDLDMRCFLRGDYTVEPRAEGTCSMRVERRKDGFHVFPLKGTTWSPGALNTMDLITVTQVHATERKVP